MKSEAEEDDAEDDAEEEDEDADMDDAEEEEEEAKEEKSDMRWASDLPDYDAAIDGDSDVEDMGEDSDEDDDGEDGEDGEEEEEEDEENAGLASSKPVKVSKASAGAAAAGAESGAFGSALDSLLSKPLPQSVLDGRQAPVLVADRTLAARHGLGTNPARALKRAALERKLARKYMLAKDHHAPQVDNVEKKLMRIATKGVVTLFNAVAKQQKELKAMQEQTEEEAGGKKKGQNKHTRNRAAERNEECIALCFSRLLSLSLCVRPVEVSKSGFLQLLKTEGANVAAATASTSLPTPGTMGVKIKKEVGQRTTARTPHSRRRRRRRRAPRLFASSDPVSLRACVFVDCPRCCCQRLEGSAGGLSHGRKTHRLGQSCAFQRGRGGRRRRVKHDRNTFFEAR